VGAALAGVLGLAVVALLISRMGAAHLWARVEAVGPRVLWMMVVYLLGTFVGALPYRWLLPADARPDLADTFTGRLVASALNVVVPGMGVVGEPSRLAWTDRAHWPAGVAAMVVDRILYAAASLALLAISLAGAVALPGLSAARRQAALGAALAVGALTVLMLVMARRDGLRGRVQSFSAAVERSWMRLKRRWPGPAAPDGLEAAAAPAAATKPGEVPPFSVAVEGCTQQILQRPPRELLGCLLVHLLGRVVLAAEVLVGLHLLGSDASAWSGLLLATLPVALSVVGAVVPAQLGLQEAAQVAASRLLGIDPAIGLLVVLLQRARQLVLVPVALGLLAFRLRGQRRRMPRLEAQADSP
jgi:hypothetical protein